MPARPHPLMFVGVLSIACGGSTGPAPAGPQVTAVTPAPQSLTTTPTGDITVRFDGPVDLASIQSAARVFGRWSGPRPGVWRLEDGGRLARFTPAGRFSAGEWVSVDLSRTVRGSDGTPRSTGYAWNFWVAATGGSLALTLGQVLPLRQPGEAWIEAYGAYAGDLNADGFPDLLIPNERSADVRVMLNDRRGNFGAMTVYPVPAGASPSTNEGADVDGDGLLDFVVGNGGNDVVAVFRGTGAGGLVHHRNYQAGRAVRGVCLLDLDGDGWPDLVTANRTGPGGGILSLFRNDGTGGFGAAQSLETGAVDETACAVADANEDGVMDLFVGALGSSEMVVLLGDGRGGLRVATRVPAGGSPWMIAAGDVDGDGHVDVVTSNVPQNTVSVLLGDGLGGLRLRGTLPVGQMPLAVDLGDLDGDGDLDLVTSNFSTADFTIYQNTGVTFTAPRTLAASSAGSCATLVDRDNDGDLDITGIDELDDVVLLFVNPG